MKKLLTTGIILSILSACKNDDSLLRINANRKITDSYSINNITRPGNYTILSDSAELAKYFAAGEVTEILKGGNANVYGLYKTINTTKYKLVVLLQVQKIEDTENYYYYLRTYDYANNRIDHFDFAAADNLARIFCSAALSKNYEIKRDCGMGEEKWKINPEGTFESVPAGE